MDNSVSILLGILILLLIVFIVLLAYLGNRFLKIKERESLNKKADFNSVKDIIEPSLQIAEKPQEHDEESLIQALRAKTPKVTSVYCIDHPDVFSQGKCAISLEPLCENCLSKQGEVSIGRKYLDLYTESDWNELTMLKENKDLKERLIGIKKQLWEKEGLPVIIQGHYKINIQTDEPEQYIVMLARDIDINRVKKEFSFLNI